MYKYAAERAHIPRCEDALCWNLDGKWMPLGYSKRSRGREPCTPTPKDVSVQKVLPGCKNPNFRFRPRFAFLLSYCDTEDNPRVLRRTGAVLAEKPRLGLAFCFLSRGHAPRGGETRTRGFVER